MSRINEQLQKTEKKSVDAAEPSSMAAQLIRAMLLRHDVPKHRQVALVGEMFGLSRAAAHRRVHGNAAWSFEEVEAIAARFGESLVSLLADAASSGGIDATLHLDAHRVPCRIWLDEGPAASLVSQPFVARLEGGQYIVVRESAAAAAAGCMRIARLKIDQQTAVKPRIAVLDDEHDVADALCAQLRHAGCEAHPYFSSHALMADLKRQVSFDGYVLDWLLRSGTVEPLLTALREQPRHSAIVLLSGKMVDGSATPAELAHASTRYRTQVYEKPARFELIMSALANDGLAGLQARS